MKHTAFTLLTLGLLALPAAAGTSILTDNFNAPDSASLDASDLSGGRMGGLLGSTVQLRSSLAQHGITMGNLRILRGANEPRIRFHHRRAGPAQLGQRPGGGDHHRRRRDAH